MDPVQAIVLAIVQGLSEFLPISSSGHLILIPHVFGWSDQGLAFDVAVHVGTLVALLVYFRRQLTTMAVAWFESVFRRRQTADSRLAWQILAATIPVGLVGLAFGDFIEANFRNPLFVAGTLSFFGILMYLADRFGRGQKDEFSLTWPQALAIGCAQALALMPGTSRSGVTMTAGRALGLSRSGRRAVQLPAGDPGYRRGGRLRRAQAADVGAGGGLGADAHRRRVRGPLRARVHPFPDPLHRAHRVAAVHALPAADRGPDRLALRLRAGLSRRGLR